MCSCETAHTDGHENGLGRRAFVRASQRGDATECVGGNGGDDDQRRTVERRQTAGGEEAGPVRRPLLVALVLGALVCGVAWFFLVKAAIDFGRLARDGQGIAWAFTAAATIGATACLLLMFILVAAADRRRGSGQRLPAHDASAGRRTR